MPATTDAIVTNLYRIRTRQPFADSGLRVMAETLAAPGTLSLSGLWYALIEAADAADMGWALPGQNGTERGGDGKGSQRGQGGRSKGAVTVAPVSQAVADAVSALSNRSAHVTVETTTANGATVPALRWSNGKSLRRELVDMHRKAVSMSGYGTTYVEHAATLRGVIVALFPDVFPVVAPAETTDAPSTDAPSTDAPSTDAPKPKPTARR